MPDKRFSKPDFLWCIFVIATVVTFLSLAWNGLRKVGEADDLPPVARVFLEGLKIPPEFIFVPGYRMPVEGGIVPKDALTQAELTAFQGGEFALPAIPRRPYDTSADRFWGSGLASRLENFRGASGADRGAARYFHRNRKAFDELAVPLLERLLDSYDTRTRLHACGILVDFGRRTPGVEAALQRLLNESEQSFDRLPEGDRALEGFPWLSEQVREVAGRAGFRLESIIDEPVYHVGREGSAAGVEKYRIRSFGSRRFGTTAIHSFAWLDPGGAMYTTWSGDFLHVWDVGSGRLLASHLERQGGRSLFSPIYAGHALRFLRGDVQLFDLIEGTVVEEAKFLDLAGEHPADRKFDSLDRPYGAASSTNRQTLAFWSLGDLWVTRDGSLQNLQRFEIGAENLQMTADGRFFYFVRRSRDTAGADELKWSFKRFDADSGNVESIRPLDHGGPWVVSANGEWLATLDQPAERDMPGTIELLPLGKEKGRERTFTVPADVRGVRIHRSASKPDSFHLLGRRREEYQSKHIASVRAEDGIGPFHETRFGEEHLDSHPNFDADRGLFVGHGGSRFEVFENGRRIGTVAPTTPFKFFGASQSDGRRLLCGGQPDGTASFFNLETGYLDTVIPLRAPADWNDVRGFSIATHRDSPWIALSTGYDRCEIRSLEDASFRAPRPADPEPSGRTFPGRPYCISERGDRLLTSRGLWTRGEEWPVLDFGKSPGYDRTLPWEHRFFKRGYALFDAKQATAVDLNLAGPAHPLKPIWLIPGILSKFEGDDGSRVTPFVRGMVFLRDPASESWTREVIHPHAKQIFADPSGDYLIYSVSSDILIHSRKQKRVIARLSAHLGFDDYVHSTALSFFECFDDGRLLTAGLDGLAIYWDLPRLLQDAEAWTRGRL